MSKPKPFPGSQMRFHTGDIVALDGDERHEGEVVAQFDMTVRVLWHGNPRMKEDLPAEQLVLIERKRKSSGPRDPSIRPQTLSPSPRRQLEQWEFERSEKRKQK